MAKRWLSLVLALTLLASATPMGGWAEGLIRKGIPVLTFAPANKTIVTEAGGPGFSDQLLGAFQVDGSANLSSADKSALESGITKEKLIYEETPSTNDLLPSVRLDGNKLYAKLKSPTAAGGKAELPIRFVDDLELDGYLTTSLRGQQIATVSVYTAVSSVKLEPEQPLTLTGKGDCATLTATVNAGGKPAADVEYAWSSSAPGIVGIEAVSGRPDQQKLTSLAEGKATITVTAQNEAGAASASCEVTVSKVESEGVVISGFGTNTTVGERVRLTATILGDANTDAVKSWSSSDESVATIDEGGVLTGISEGITVITVTTVHGRTHAPSVRVYASTNKVEDPTYNLSGALSRPGAEVEIATTTVGAEIYYTMTGNGAAPAALTAANAAIVGTLYAGPVALTENKTYRFNAIAVKGSAASFEVKGDFPVDIAVTGFTLDKTAVTVDGKEEVALTAAWTPAEANVKDITWTTVGDVFKTEKSSDGKTFKLTTTGTDDVRVEATVFYGNAQPRATKKAACRITVNPVAETGVSASPAALSIPAGQTRVLEAVVTPANASHEAVDFYFNANSKAITVPGFEDGVALKKHSIRIAARDGGEGESETITLVTENGLRATCRVSVTAASSKVAAPVFDAADGAVFPKPDAADRTVRLTSATAGASFAYTLNGAPGAGASMEIPVNKTAVVVAWATKDGLQKSDAVTATFTSAVAATGVELGGEIIIKGKDAKALTATVKPANAKNKALTWKSNDPTVATVAQKAGAGNEQTAIITAVKPGAATITATTEDGGHADSVTVTVEPAAPESVEIHDADGKVSDTTLTLNNGEAVQLAAKGFDGNLQEVKPFATPIWTSSDNAIAAVNSAGRVVVPGAAGAGRTATITATLGGIPSTVTIKVGAKPTKVAELKLDVAGGAKGSDGKYTSEITVKAATATDGAQITYTLDGKEPTADSTPFPSGGVKLSAKATLRAGAFKSALDPAFAAANYDFNIAVAEVRMEKTSLTLTRGETAQLKATIAPANATNAKIVWSAEPSALAAIGSETGILTAKGVGEVTVTATAGSMDAACAVKIVDVEATAIELAPSAATLVIGESKQLTPLMRPDGLIGKTISWTTSDEFVAKVSDAGRVTARKAGTATITATVDGVKATAAITVEAPPATIPAEPKKEVSFAPVKAFTVIEGGSLSQVLGKLQPGEDETMDQIRYFCEIGFENFSAPALSPTFDVARDGTVTLNIANVGSATTTFRYTWTLTAKAIPGFTPSAALGNSGRTISGNQLKVVQKPRAIGFTETPVAAFEMKVSEKKSVDVGKIGNYADFVATRVDVKAAASGVDKGATAAIAADGTVTLSLSGLAKGKHTIAATLTASGCDPVRTTGFEVTVAEDPPPAEKKVAVSAAATKPSMATYKKKPVHIVNLRDKNIAFSVPGYTVTNWKSSKPKLLSINASGEATLKKAGTTRITVTATLSDGTKAAHLVSIRKIATSVTMQYKKGKKWVAFGDAAVSLIKGKKLAVRVVAAPKGSKIYASQKWKGNDTAIATIKSGKITARGVGETTFRYVLDNGFVAIAKINVLAKGSKGVAPAEPEPQKIDGAGAENGAIAGVENGAPAGAESGAAAEEAEGIGTEAG